MKQKKVLCIGSATQDIFLHYEDPKLLELEENYKKVTYLLLEQGSKINVKEINYYTGGGSTNTGTSFKKLGFEATSLFKIGNDFQGDFILKELQKINLSIVPIYSKNSPTAQSFILPTPSDRIVLAFRGANTELSKDEISESLIIENDLIYITPLNGQSSNLLSYITETAKKNNKIVALNPGIGQLKEIDNTFIQSLKSIDVLILNAKEAELLLLNLLKVKKENFSFDERTEIEANVPSLIKFFTKYNNSSLTIHDYFKLILQQGPKTAVVTNGAEGVYVSNKDKIYFHSSIKSEKIVNTLGAGDAFGSTFVASLLKGKSIEDSIYYSILNASSVISHEGAKTGLLTFDELEIKAKVYLKSSKCFYCINL